MATVYSLQHAQDFRDPNTDVDFSPCNPFIARVIEDDYGRVMEYLAQSVSVQPVTDPEHLEYFELRPNLYYVVEDEEARALSGEIEGAFRIEHHAGPWYVVVNREGERVNEDGEPGETDKALKQVEAEALAAVLNANTAEAPAEEEEVLANG